MLSSASNPMPRDFRFDELRERVLDRRRWRLKFQDGTPCRCEPEACEQLHGLAALLTEVSEKRIALAASCPCRQEEALLADLVGELRNGAATIAESQMKAIDRSLGIVKTSLPVLGAGFLANASFDKISG